LTEQPGPRPGLAPGRHDIAAERRAKPAARFSPPAGSPPVAPPARATPGKQSIIDSIPYFLGAVDETTARAEVRLRKLRTEYDRELRRLEAARAEAAQADD
jgi:hypothetical protein